MNQRREALMKMGRGALGAGAALSGAGMIDAKARSAAMAQQIPLARAAADASGLINGMGNFDQAEWEREEKVRRQRDEIISKMHRERQVQEEKQGMRRASWDYPDSELSALRSVSPQWKAMKTRERMEAVYRERMTFQEQMQALYNEPLDNLKTMFKKMMEEA